MIFFKDPTKHPKGDDGEHIGLDGFTLFLSSLPLLYIFPLALLCLTINFFRNPPSTPAIPGPNYGTVGSQPPAYHPINPETAPSAHRLTYFSKSASTYFFITLAQLALIGSAIIFTMLVHPSPHINSNSLLEWYLIDAAFWVSYGLFLSTFKTISLFNSGFIFFNIFAWSLTPITLFSGFLFINGISSTFLWCIYFATFLAQCSLTSLIGIIDVYNVFAWLFS